MKNIYLLPTDKPSKLAKYLLEIKDTSFFSNDRGYAYSLDCDIAVLGVSRKKFEELISENDCYVQRDKGLTEVEAGTPTAAAWIVK